MIEMSNIVYILYMRDESFYTESFFVHIKNPYENEMLKSYTRSSSTPKNKLSCYIVTCF